MRFFNTAGPIDPDEHYHIPPLDRIDLDELLGLVRDKRYFVLHAPRQTGKTSVLLALRDRLNATGDYRCVYANVEPGQAMRENVADGMRTVLGELAIEASETLGDESLKRIWPEVLERAGPGLALREALLRWSRADPRPLVLMLDEIDALVGDTLLAVQAQLRAGYPGRPARFPQSVVLCGVRDARDERIVRKALRLGDLTEGEVRALLRQHTEETGQVFTDGALAAVWRRTAGQPWLVNALCRGACFDSKPGRDRSRVITEVDILDAQERLILTRETHLDHLAHKLCEARVQRVVEPILDRSSLPAWSSDDLDYARDLGIVTFDGNGSPCIANPIYAEVMPRYLNEGVQVASSSASRIGPRGRPASGM